ncbi:MAG TPA: hypothetical protein VGM79_13830 [Streptosporangiaceae bacterium]|jgi:hypothetical protein
MYLPYSMQNVMYEQQLSDAGRAAMGRGAPAPARGSRRPARAGRTHEGHSTLAARWLASHVQSAKPRAARLP